MPSENVYNAETGKEGMGPVKKWKWPEPGELIEEAGPQEMEERLNKLDATRRRPYNCWKRSTLRGYGWKLNLGLSEMVF